MRRLLILLFLLAGTELILPLGSQGHGSQALLSFGFIILAAYTVGEIATAIRIPKIVGYLIAGVVFGPYVLGVVSHEGAERLTTVSNLAVAMIAFLAGAELQWKEVRERGVLLLKITGVELLVAFVALVGLLYGVHEFIPPLRGAPLGEVLAFVLLFASVAIVHSPAVTLALLAETGARGPVARTTLGVVLIADVVVVLLFSAMLTLSRSLTAGGGGPDMSFGLILWEIGGALVIGALIGAGIALYLRYVGRELIMFGILVAFFGLELAELLHTELLLTLLAAGFVAENASPRGEELRHAIERSAAMIFVVFFALSGAKIDLGLVAPLMPLILPIAVVRAAGIWTGVRIGAAWARAPQPERRWVWLGLVSQVGVAIGLANIVAEAYPSHGETLRSLLLALIAVNQTVGPILFRRALDRSGELPAPAAAPAPSAEGARA